MNIKQLQQRLLGLELDLGPAGADGIYGSYTRRAVLAALTNVHANRIADIDILEAARDLGCKPEIIRAVLKVESNGNGFGPESRPIILYEPHVFSRQSGHRFDNTHGGVSSKHWNRELYKKTQQGRYEQLLYAIGLDVDAAFQACSWGLFQILGENWALCGYESPWAMAWVMSRSEGDQLDGLVRFIQGNSLQSKLRACTTSPDQCIGFVRAYNGKNFRVNNYHVKLAAEIGRQMASAA